MDIVSLLSPQARARRNALRALNVMRSRREQAEDAQRAAAAFEDRHQRRLQSQRVAVPTEPPAPGL